MEILVVNVNTTDSITEAIRKQAERHAAPGTRITAVTPAFGPKAVEDYVGANISALAVTDYVLALPPRFDAIIEAGFGEHGTEGLQELVPVPVIGITEAAAAIASLLGRRYSVITTLPRAAAQIEDRLLVTGLSTRCVSIRPVGIGVLDVSHPSDTVIDRLIDEARVAIRDDRADVICLGCAGMADLQERVSKAVPVPVVDGVAAAVKVAETFHELGLKSAIASAKWQSVVEGWTGVGGQFRSPPNEQ